MGRVVWSHLEWSVGARTIDGRQRQLRLLLQMIPGHCRYHSRPILPCLRTRMIVATAASCSVTFRPPEARRSSIVPGLPMSSIMLAEAREAPARVAALLREDATIYAALARALSGRRLASLPPSPAAARACGDLPRQSARHRASGLATACDRALVGDSGARLAVERRWSLVLSQSGASPDIVSNLSATRAAAPATVAIVNADGSPLAAAAEYRPAQAAPVPSGASPQPRASCTRPWQPVWLRPGEATPGCWRHSSGCRSGSTRLCPAMVAAVPLLCPRRAASTRWRAALRSGSHRKCPEAQERPAPAPRPSSTAEVQHGPRAIVGAASRFSSTLCPTPAARTRRASRRSCREAGADVLLASPTRRAACISRYRRPLHPLLDPIVAIQAFYPLANAVAGPEGSTPTARAASARSRGPCSRQQ